jgi:hypothetical protein
MSETLEEKRNRLAKSRYGESYYWLCSMRQDIIDKLVRMEEENGSQEKD